MSARILIIDNDEMVRETISALLSVEGYTTRCLPDAGNISDLIHLWEPDIILLDIMLDNADGRDICRELKSDPKTSFVPVIMLSALPDLYNAIINAGANDVISKPFEERVLLNRIERQIMNSASHS